MTFSVKRSRRGFRVWVTILTVGVWAGLMGYLLKDRFVETGRALTDSLNIVAAETDDWFLIRIGGSYAGFGRSRQFQREGRWTILDELNVSLNIQGQIKPVRIVNEAEVDGNFRLISFRMKVSSGVMGFEQKGRMQGRELVLDVPDFKGGGTIRLKVAETPVMSRSLGLPVPLTGIQVGDKFRVPIFDPLDGNKWDAEIRVLEKANLEISGEKIEAWRVRAIFRAVELVMWIDAQGRLLKGAMPLGITVIRSDKEEIGREMKTARSLPDFVSISSVPVEGFLPDTPNLKSVKLKVIGDATLNIPSDTVRQSVKGSELTITKEELPKATYSLPCTDPQMAENLASSRFLRSDDPKVAATAREIVGNEKDPVRCAELINAWVYKNIKKVPTPSVPDAYTVLMNRQGDCNEHSVLAVSLARAVGLPARMVVGLVYNEGAYYYHAWASYWAGNRWFTGDPLMNQMPVAPTHIALIYGDVDKHLNVISYLGRIRFKVVEAK